MEMLKEENVISEEKKSNWSIWDPLPKLPNPGKYEDLNKESKEICGTAELFEGFKFEINKGASETFGITHSFNLGSTQEPANYSLSATYMDKGTLLLAKIDTATQMFGRYHQTLSDKVAIRAIGQASNEPHNSAFHGEIDYASGPYVAQFKWTNPGTYGFSYFQSITDKLALGCDAFYNYKQAFSMASIGARWADDKHIFTGFGAISTLNISYTRKVSSKVALSSELLLQGTQNGWESLYTVGFKYQLTQSSFKGTITSSSRVTGVLEETITPFSKFMISGELDHKKKEYRFGFGMAINM